MLLAEKICITQCITLSSNNIISVLHQLPSQMYYILTTFLEQCSSIYVNIKGGGTIPTLLNQVEWKLLCLASDVIPLYTRCAIAVMCRRN